jgi:amino acid transporter
LGRLVRCVTVAILIVYGVVCVSYLEFYKWYVISVLNMRLRNVQLTTKSIQLAANGDDENVNDKDDPDVRQHFDRNSPGYPYKSHGQWLRACYGLLGCFLLVVFNGWRSLGSPMKTGDFLGCYISVSLIDPSI